MANQVWNSRDKDTVTLLVPAMAITTGMILERNPGLALSTPTVEMGPDEYMYVVGSLLVNRADNINDKDDDKN